MPENWTNNHSDIETTVIRLDRLEERFATIENRTDGTLIDFFNHRIITDNLARQLLRKIKEPLALDPDQKDSCLSQVAEVLSREQAGYREAPFSFRLHFSPTELISIKLNYHEASDCFDLRLANDTVVNDTFLALLPHMRAPSPFQDEAEDFKKLLTTLGLLEKPYLEKLGGLIPPEGTRCVQDQGRITYYGFIHETIQKLSDSLTPVTV